jgi:hypothetical protein
MLMLRSVMLVVLSVWVGSAAPMLTLLPSPDLVGSADSVVGWGFTISNDANYIEFTTAQFCVNFVGLPSCTSPLTGTFNDFITSFNDVIVGFPGGTLPPTVTQAYDETTMQGVGSFAISAAAPLFQQDAGAIVLEYNIYSLDPNDSDSVFLGSGVLSAPASVTVVVPEPSLLIPIGAAMAGLIARRRMRGAASL